MRFLLIAVTAALIVVSVVALGGFAVLVWLLLDPRFGLTRLLLAGVLGFTVAGPIAHNTLTSLITRSSATSTYNPWWGRRQGHVIVWSWLDGRARIGLG